MSVQLPDDTIRQLDEKARAERRSRSNLIALMLAAGQARLEELERLGRSAAATVQRPEAGATEAGRAHLAEHRRMSGLDPASPSEETDHHG